MFLIVQQKTLIIVPSSGVE